MENTRLQQNTPEPAAGRPRGGNPLPAPGPWWKNIPTDLIGDVLYRVGFLVEYFLICTGRAVLRAARAVWHYTAFLVRAVVRPFWLGIATLIGDLARPLAQIFIDFLTLHRLAAGHKGESPEQTRARRAEYLRQSRAIYRGLLLNVLAYVPPILAAMALVVVVRRGMAQQFVLDVRVNGNSIGSVQSEQIFDTAYADVRSRLSNAKQLIEAAGNTAPVGQWDIAPTYTLTVGNATLNQMEMADTIMAASDNEIGQGTAVYVDGALQFVTTEGDHLRTYLENVKAPYENTLDPNTQVTFSHDIRLVDGVFMLSSVEDYPEVISAFNANPGIYYYTAGPNETAQTAVNNTGINWDSFAMLNPELLTLDQKIPEGTQLVTGASSPEWLKVQVVERQSYVEDIAFESETRTSDEYAFGRIVTLQEGQTGQQQITQDVTYVDGKVVSVNVVGVDVIREPVKEIKIRGTRLDSGMIAPLGNGSFMWPVPTIQRVSRWVTYFRDGSVDHKAADIAGPIGTPIYASDSGYVTEARDGAGTSYWSYGKFVTIDHGNGYVTRYAHMSSMTVSEGQTVKQGDLIGYIGNTGRSFGSHCHFEIWHNGTIVNPKNLFPWVTEF